jgi:hypothetical protein
MQLFIDANNGGGGDVKVQHLDSRQIPLALDPAFDRRIVRHTSWQATIGYGKP